MSKGRFGEYGGQYVPETLMNAVHEVEEAYEKYKNDPEFNRELDDLLKNYAGRPSLLYEAKKMTRDLGGAKIYLKREDLNHTGAHKINNVLGQVLLAKKMGYIYVDTGAMYRAMAVYFVQNNVNPDDEREINAAVTGVNITIEYMDGVQQVILNGDNVTGMLRTEEIGSMASKTSKYAAVRRKLVELQRELAKKTDVIMDGRDIGTTVLPDAFCKIYLTASVDARAKRRYDELAQKGEKCDYDIIKKDIEQRDYQDMHREISPLKQADDAVLVDTSDMNIEQVVECIENIINERK